MGQGFGREVPSPHLHTAHQRAARYLVVIESAGTMLARLFLDDRTPVAEFDAGAEEVALMLNGLQAERSAEGPEWDQALTGHSRSERAAALVYTLAV